MYAKVGQRVLKAELRPAEVDLRFKIWPRKIGCVGIGLEDWQVEEGMGEWGIPTAR